MNKLLIASLLILQSFMAVAQEEAEYVQVMVNQKKAIKMATTEKDFQDLADNFARISTTATDKWHPLYYAAFCCINKSFVAKEPEVKDNGLDQAQKYIDKALEIYPEESELWVLQGLLYQGKIQIDPMKRGKDYSQKANQALSKAKSFNPENPRAYYLLGLNALHTPKAFGGGPDAACPLFKSALDKFTTYIPDHVLSPGWGGEECDKQYNTNCQKSN